jgi:ParB family chromosome partitioning protein
MPKKTTNVGGQTTDFFANLKMRAGNLQKLAEGAGIPEEESDKIELLSLNTVLPNPDQPRQNENADEDAELAEDIKAHGILQPIIVRLIPDKPGHYQIVAGQRRTNAAKAAGYTVIPAIVKNYDDRKARTIAAIENLQRKNLEPVEEAYYFKFLADEYNLSNRDIAQLIHKSPSYIDQRMRLLKPEEANRVKNTQTLEISQSITPNSAPTKPPRVWKYQPKEWEKIRVAINQARTGYTGAKPEQREALRETIQTLKKELEELEIELSEQSGQNE